MTVDDKYRLPHQSSHRLSLKINSNKADTKHGWNYIKWNDKEFNKGMCEENNVHNEKILSSNLFLDYSLIIVHRFYFIAVHKIS